MTPQNGAIHAAVDPKLLKKDSTAALLRNVSRSPALSYGSMSLSLPMPHSKEYVTSPRQPRVLQWYINMILINLVEFAAESSRGVVLVTLFLYTESLGGDLAFMGFLTSIFSVGRLISSTLFGWLCDHYSFKMVYILSAGICMVGNFIYIMADQHVMDSLYVLAFARFTVGFGAGNRSVCRANVAAVTSIEQRLKYLTILATVVFLGYALTPGFGAIDFVADEDKYFLGIHLNKFTIPGVFLVSLNLLTIGCMLALYDESVTKNDAPPESVRGFSPANNLGTPPTTINSPMTDSHASNLNAIVVDDDEEDLSHLDDVSLIPEHIVKIGAVIFIFLNFNSRGILSIFETVNIPLFLQVTGENPDSSGSVVLASDFQFYLGCLGLLSYFAIEYFRHAISEVTWVLLGFGFLTGGNILLAIFPDHLTLPRLIIAELLVWSIGCPITTAVVVAAFSKLLGGRPQGTLMGFMGSAASIARIVLPLLPSIFTAITPLFWINIALCSFCMASLVWYSRLIHRTKLEIIQNAVMMNT